MPPGKKPDAPHIIHTGSVKADDVAITIDENSMLIKKETQITLDPVSSIALVNPFPNEKSLQTTISFYMKMAKSSPKG